MLMSHSRMQTKSPRHPAVTPRGSVSNPLAALPRGAASALATSPILLEADLGPELISNGKHAAATSRRDVETVAALVPAPATASARRSSSLSPHSLVSL